MVQALGPSLQTVREVANLLTGMKRGHVLFLDEIHGLPPRCAELLYSAMEDGFIDIVLGPSPALPVRIPLEPFTLVGATTRLAKVPQPLRDRFGQYHTFSLEFYDEDVLGAILNGYAAKTGVQYSDKAIQEIARRGRGTPRIAIDLLNGAMDYATSLCQPISWEVASQALDSVGIDHKGLNKVDRTYLVTLLENFGGNPAGVEAMASVMNTEVATLDSVVEPWLLRLGFIQRTPRGRIITEAGKAHLGI
jgi:Holliday junction DNA helicase RuvB